MQAMIERIVPPNRPVDEASGQSVERAESAEQVEKNTREHFDLRLRFAEAVSKKKVISLADAIRDYTDLHVRLTGKWPGQTEQTDRLWQDFADSISAESDHGRILDRIMQFSRRPEADRTEHEGDRFYPFRYSYDAENRAIDLHFGSMRPEAGDPHAPGILSSERFAEMRLLLKEMFAEIKNAHPDAEVVRGGSWLYNREAYRRLYPATYTANPRIRRGNLTGGGTWGQFRDKTGAVNDSLRQQFLHGLQELDPDHLEDAFPYKTLMVAGPISDFYKEYGIE